MPLIQDIANDISCADQAIKEAGFGTLLPDEELLCEIYRLPSHNKNTVYARVYDGKQGIRIEYARPEIYKLGITIRMYCFREAISANTRNSEQGRIICGTQYISSPSANSIRRIISMIPKQCLPDASTVCIDDVTYFLRTDTDQLALNLSWLNRYEQYKTFYGIVNMIDSIIESLGMS